MGAKDFASLTATEDLGSPGIFVVIGSNVRGR